MDYELWPEHLTAWLVYVSCSSQWRIVSMGDGMTGMDRAVWLGLDYQGVEVVMRAQRVPNERWGEVFSEVQVLEDEEVRQRNAS